MCVTFVMNQLQWKVYAQTPLRSLPIACRRPRQRALRSRDCRLRNPETRGQWPWFTLHITEDDATAAARAEGRAEKRKEEDLQMQIRPRLCQTSAFGHQLTLDSRVKLTFPYRMRRGLQKPLKGLNRRSKGCSAEIDDRPTNFIRRACKLKWEKYACGECNSPRGFHGHFERALGGC